MITRPSQFHRRVLHLVALASVALLATSACRSRHARPAQSEPNNVVESSQSPLQQDQAKPEAKWSSETVLTFLLDTEREIRDALPYPKWDEKEPPFVGQCWDNDVRGYWKAADVLPVLDKRMTPAMRACRMVAFGCVIGPWIGRYYSAGVYLPFVGSKVTIVDVSANRVVADVDEGDTDDVSVHDGNTLNWSVIGSGWEPTVSRYVFERGTDNTWRITDKTNLWNHGNCDQGPVVLFPTPRE